MTSSPTMSMALMDSTSILLAGAPAFAPAVALAGAFAGAFAVASAAVGKGGKPPGGMMVMSAALAASATITSAAVAGKSPGKLMVISAAVDDSAADSSAAVALFLFLLLLLLLIWLLLLHAFPSCCIWSLLGLNMVSLNFQKPEDKLMSLHNTHTDHYSYIQDHATFVIALAFMTPMKFFLSATGNGSNRDLLGLP